LYDLSSERIEKETDIVKIMKKLRNLKILLSNSLMTPEVKFSIAYTDKNVINLDESIQEADKEGDDNCNDCNKIANRTGTTDPT